MMRTRLPVSVLLLRPLAASGAWRDSRTCGLTASRRPLSGPVSGSLRRNPLSTSPLLASRKLLVGYPAPRRALTILILLPDFAAPRPWPGRAAPWNGAYAALVDCAGCLIGDCLLSNRAAIDGRSGILGGGRRSLCARCRLIAPLRRSCRIRPGILRIGWDGLRKTWNGTTMPRWREAAGIGISQGGCRVYARAARDLIT